MADALKERVASGQYESESDVSREGLLALEAQEASLERWLEIEGVARFDAWKADAEAPTFTPDQVREWLRSTGRYTK